MIQVSKTVCALFAILVLASNPVQLFADAPEVSFPTVASPGGNQSGAQHLGYQTNSQPQAQLQQVDCTDNSCRSYGYSNGYQKCGNCQCSQCKNRRKSSNCNSCQNQGGLLSRLFNRNNCGSGYCKAPRSDSMLFGRLHQKLLGSNHRMIPKGCGGKGCPPFGRYQMVYPADPSYFDQRDGNVHAAQGYGVPMAVPLAPVVRQQYNYSWGVPASRLTPISNPAPGGLGY